MNHHKERNLIRYNKNKIIYFIDYDVLVNSTKEDKVLFENYDLFNNINTLFLLNNISITENVLEILNNIFDKSCEVILNNNKIDLQIFLKILYVINKNKKHNYLLFILDNYTINYNNIFNDVFNITFKNKKIIKLELNDNILLNLYSNKEIIDTNVNIDFSYEMDNTNYLNNTDILKEYTLNLFNTCVDINYKDIYFLINEKNINIKSVKQEFNIYSSLYFFTYQLNKDFIGGFCKLINNETEFKLNDVKIDTNDYLNLYYRLFNSFKNYNYTIKNIEIKDENKITVNYKFKGIYNKARFYLNDVSHNIIPNNQEIIIDNERIEFIIDEKLNKISKIHIKNDNSEYCGLELIYHKLIETTNDNPELLEEFSMNWVNIIDESGNDIIDESGINIIDRSGNDIMDGSGNDIMDESGINIIDRSGNDIMDGSGNDIMDGSGNDSIEINKL